MDDHSRVSGPGQAPAANIDAREIASKTYNSCKEAVNNLPGSFSKHASTEERVTRAAAIIVFNVGTVISGYTLPAAAVALGVGYVFYKAYEHAQAANTNDNSVPAQEATGMKPIESPKSTNSSHDDEIKIVMDSDKNTQPSSVDAPGVITNQKNNFTEKDISDWLFDAFKDGRFPESQLGKREKDNYAPKIDLSKICRLSKKGKYTGRIGIYQGGITDIRAAPGQKVAVGDSNNGDLLTGCGNLVAKAIVNAAGPNLQRDLYNKYGVPGLNGKSDYGKENYGDIEDGRGYSLTCDSHDMKDTHNISYVEFMTVPQYDKEGVRRMYREAFNHSENLDFILLPTAGMTHPVLRKNPKLSAEIATEEFKKFVDTHKGSHLKVIFVVWEKDYVPFYKKAARDLDKTEN